MDVMILMGVELVDPIPEDDKWVKKIKYLEKVSNVSISDYDLDDEMDREFLYKKYIAVSTEDFFLIGSLSGITQADLDTAKKLF